VSLVIPARLFAFAHELKIYEWQDKKTTTPVKGADHLCNAVSYEFMAITTPQQGVRVVNPSEYSGTADYIRL